MEALRDMEELLTVEEAAAYLRVSKATLWRWCQQKRLPAFKIGRQWRIDRGILRQFTASNDHGANPSERA